MIVTIPRILIEVNRTVGGPAFRFPDVETCQKVHDFALTAAKSFVNTLAPALNGKKFKFVFCSGKGAEWDQTKRLWFWKDTRRIKVSESSYHYRTLRFGANSDSGLYREAIV